MYSLQPGEFVHWQKCDEDIERGGWVSRFLAPKPWTKQRLPSLYVRIAAYRPLIFLGYMMYSSVRDCVGIELPFIQLKCTCIDGLMHWCPTCLPDGLISLCINIFFQLYQASIYSISGVHFSPAILHYCKDNSCSFNISLMTSERCLITQETSEKSFELPKASVASECNGPKDCAVLCRCQLSLFFWILWSVERRIQQRMKT